MNRTFFEYHPTIGYKFIPDIKTRVMHEAGGYLVKTNNYGFRSDEDFQTGRTAGRKRALVFGDSFTAGDGVSNKFRFTDILQQQLNVDVYNFGLPGSGTDQQYLLYQEYAGRFEHDLLVICVLVENIRRVNSAYRYYLDAEGAQKVWMKPYFAIEDNMLVLKNTPVDPKPIEVAKLDEAERSRIDTGGKFEDLRKLVKKLGLKEMAQKFVRFQPVPEYDSPDSTPWLLMKKILTDWIGNSSVPVILVPVPLFHHVEETADSQPYRERFAELKDICTVHDPLPELLTYTMEKRREFRFGKDVHLTPQGHHAIANSLKPILQQFL